MEYTRAFFLCDLIIPHVLNTFSIQLHKMFSKHHIKHNSLEQFEILMFFLSYFLILWFLFCYGELQLFMNEQFIATTTANISMEIVGWIVFLRKPLPWKIIKKELTFRDSKGNKLSINLMPNNDCPAVHIRSFVVDKRGMEGMEQLEIQYHKNRRRKTTFTTHLI